MHIIHYTTLDDLLTDASIGATVYVSQQISVRFDQDQNNITYRITIAQAFARISDADTVRSYTPYMQEVTTMRLVDTGKERKTHKQITREATDIATVMFNAIQLAGYRTRTAIVDLHGAQPVQGQAWQLTKEEEEQREKEEDHQP